MITVTISLTKTEEGLNVCTRICVCMHTCLCMCAHKCRVHTYVVCMCVVCGGEVGISHKKFEETTWKKKKSRNKLTNKNNTHLTLAKVPQTPKLHVELLFVIIVVVVVSLIE